MPVPPQHRVLVLGRSQLVLDETVAALRDLGYRAEATNDFFADIAGQFDASAIDLVVFGTQVPADRQAELRKEISTSNPRVIILEGLAGIPGLIASQVQEAFGPAHRDPARAPDYHAPDRSIRLTLTDPATVTVTVWWRTAVIPPDPKSDSLILHHGQLIRGRHTFDVPAHVFLPPDHVPDSPAPAPAVFATVQVDAEIYNFAFADGKP